MAVDSQIDKLVIDIETKVSKDTISNINAVSDSLERLKSILSSDFGNLDNVVNQINKLGAVSQVSFADVNSRVQEVAATVVDFKKTVESPLSTEHGRLIQEFDLISKKIKQTEERYAYLSDVVENLGNVSVTTTKEQAALLIELARSGMSFEDVQREHESSTTRLISLYRQFDSITNKLAGNMQRTSTVDVATQFNEQRNSIRDLVSQYDTLVKMFGVLDPQAMSVAGSIYAANQQLQSLGEQLTQLDPTQTEKVNNAAFKYNEVLRKISINQALANDEVAESATVTQSASFGWDKLLLSIKRIAFYRLVRRAIQLIGKEITAAISSFAQFDERTNQSISNLQSSWKAFGNSIGIVFSQLINTAAPTLIRILDLATSVGNAISLIFATISGEDYYTKAIKYQTDYAESLKKTNEQLATFDKFNVLQKQQQAPIMFETEEVETGWAKMSNTTLALIAALETLIALKVVGWLSDVVTGLISFIKFMKTAEGATYALHAAQVLLRTVGIFLLIYALMQLIMRWDELSNGMRAAYIALAALGVALIIFSNKTILTTTVKAIATFIKSLKTTQLSVLSTTKSITAMNIATAALGAVIVFIALDTWFSSMDKDSRKFAGTAAIIIGAIMAITAAILAMNSTISWGTALLPLLAGVAAAIAGVKAISVKPEEFAAGGIPDTKGGSAFIMNERGRPELIHENSKGQVQVSNQESLRGAFLEALRQYDMEKQYSNNGQETTEKIDVATVSGDVVFELVKTTASKKGFSFVRAGK